MSDLRVLRDLVPSPMPAALVRAASAAPKPPEKTGSKPTEDTVELPPAAAKIASWEQASRNDPLVLRLAETARKMRTEYEATIRDLRDPLSDWQIRAVRDNANLSRRSGASGKALVTPGPNGARDAKVAISEYSATLFRALDFAIGALQSGRLAGL